MSTFRRNYLIATLAVLAIALTSLMANPAVAQPDPRPGATQPVQIMGPLPVPVTGTVSGAVSVSGSVAVTNTPLPVTGTVGLSSGTVVTVGNTATNPVPVRSITSPRTPFQVRAIGSATNGISADASVANVP